jgi:hypothetical protein
MTLETFEPLKDDTFTILAFGGTGDDGVEYDHAEIQVTLEAIEKSTPICYPDTYARDDQGAFKLDADGKKIVEKEGEPVPDMPAPFTLVFRAPDHTPIWDGVYPMKNAKIGELGEIALTRDVQTMDGKTVCMDGGKQVEVEGRILDHWKVILHANIGRQRPRTHLAVPPVARRSRSHIRFNRLLKPANQGGTLCPSPARH